MWLQSDGTPKGIVSFIAKEVDAKRIIMELKEKIPAYMIPNRIITLKEMPFNTSGKVDRLALSQILEERNI